MHQKRARRSISMVLVVVLLFAMTMPTFAQTQGASKENVQITILGTSDLHGRIYPWDYASDKEDAAVGYAKVATVVNEVRKQNPNTIVVDAGDTIQDNSIELFHQDPTNPMIDAMNQIGYNAWTLGNHEFNFGLDVLGRAMKGSKAAVLAGNIRKADGSRFAKAYEIVEVDGVKVALIGMIAPHVPRWEGSTPEHFKGLTFTDPLVETKQVVKELKGKVDVMIGVMHLGKESEYNMPNASIEAIAKGVPELTAIVSGHAHSDIPGEMIGGVLVVEPSSNGKKVSRIDLNLEKTDGNWSVASKTSENIDTSKYEADAKMLESFKYVHDKSRENANVIIGKVGEDFIKTPQLLPGIPTIQVQDTALIDLINTVQLAYAKTDLSAAAAFKSDMNLLKGDFKKKDAVNIYKYDNTLIGAKLTGKELKNYMEWSAKYYNQYQPGDLTVSFNQDVRGYNYDMFAGVDYEIDISKPAGSRITKLMFKGKPVTEDMTFTIAINNYRFSGLVADGILRADSKVYDSYDLYGDKGRIRDLIGTYIAEKGEIKPECDQNWKLVGYDFTSPLKDLVYEMVKAGAITLPTSEDGRTPNVKALNVNDAEIKALEGLKKIDIYSINDFHGAIKENGKNVGSAKLVNEIKVAKEQNPNTLFVAGGDLFQGTPESNMLKGEPVAVTLKEAGLLASAIGNHELDWQMSLLRDWQSQGGFEFLCANMFDKASGELVDFAKPYKIVDVDGTKVAFIGLITPETATATKPTNVKDVVFKTPEEVLPQYIEEVKAAGADIVIALGHIGAAQDSKTKAITGEVESVAKVPGLDAIIAGHTHQYVAGKIGNVPVAMGGYNGRAMAKTVILVDPVTNEIKESYSWVDELYKRAETLKADAATQVIVDQYVKDLEPITSQKLGTAEVDLSHEGDGATLMGEWAATIMKEAVGADVAIQNGGGLRCSIPAGAITMGDLYQLMPFDNTLYTVKLTGKQLKAAVENGIGSPTFRFGQVAGLYVTYDLSKPYGSRVMTMSLENGQPIQDDKEYLVATNDFMADGGDNYVVFKEGKERTNTNIPIRDLLVDYIKKHKTIKPQYKGYQQPIAQNVAMEMFELAA
ncbi:MAG: 5'-nucleotidase C-terminal domain-containing protein [Cellulosilyticaceae bacterium]